jgi:hypothetical protein
MHMAIVIKMDTGQFPTYLFLFIIPPLIFYLVSTVIHLSPINRRSLAKLLLSTPRTPGLRGRSCSPPRPRGRGPWNRPLRLHDKQRIIRIRDFINSQNKNWRWRTYLFAVLWFFFQVGCCFEVVLRTTIKWMHAVRRPSTLVRLALQAWHSSPQDNVCFDSDSFAVGVDNHASCCIGNDKHIFENLALARTAQRVGGISKGLAIEGKGTLVVTINDNNGKSHRIKIPNSLYLPGLRMCLLLPQHWVQEARDANPLPNGTRMENNAHSCKLFWGQGRFVKTIPFDDATNTSLFYTLPLTTGYRAFVHTFQALEAPFFSREHMLQLPGHRWLDRSTPPPRQDFVAEENINYKKTTTGNEGVVQAYDDTVIAGNLPPPPDEAHPDAVHRQALTLDPPPPLAEEDEYSLSAPNDQAELMPWHYRLGHKPFRDLRPLPSMVRFRCASPTFARLDAPAASLGP